MSKSDNGLVLVNDGRKLYNYDKITASIYGNPHPESVDSFYASEKKVFFIEYKTGFKKKVRRENLSANGMTCPDDAQKRCKDYERLFFKNQDNEEKILRNSIHMKAIESYITFMHKIEPHSQDDGPRKNLVLQVVIDDYIESMEDTLTELAKKPSTTNSMTSLRQSLNRFHKNRKKDYYFDEIQVLSPYEFKQSIPENI